MRGRARARLVVGALVTAWALGSPSSRASAQLELGVETTFGGGDTHPATGRSVGLAARDDGFLFVYSAIGASATRAARVTRGGLLLDRPSVGVAPFIDPHVVASGTHWLVFGGVASGPELVAIPVQEPLAPSEVRVLGGAGASGNFVIACGHGRCAAAIETTIGLGTLVQPLASDGTPVGTPVEFGLAAQAVALDVSEHGALLVGRVGRELRAIRLDAAFVPVGTHLDLGTASVERLAVTAHGDDWLVTSGAPAGGVAFRRVLADGSVVDSALDDASIDSWSVAGTSGGWMIVTRGFELGSPRVAAHFLDGTAREVATVPISGASDVGATACIADVCLVVAEPFSPGTRPVLLGPSGVIRDEGGLAFESARSGGGAATLVHGHRTLAWMEDDRLRVAEVPGAEPMPTVLAADPLTDRTAQGRIALANDGTRTLIVSSSLVAVGVDGGWTEVATAFAHVPSRAFALDGAWLVVDQFGGPGAGRIVQDSDGAWRESVSTSFPSFAFSAAPTARGWGAVVGGVPATLIWGDARQVTGSSALRSGPALVACAGDACLLVHGEGGALAWQSVLFRGVPGVDTGTFPWSGTLADAVAVGGGFLLALQDDAGDAYVALVAVDGSLQVPPTPVGTGGVLGLSALDGRRAMLFYVRDDLLRAVEVGVGPGSLPTGAAGCACTTAGAGPSPSRGALLVSLALLALVPRLVRRGARRWESPARRAMSGACTPPPRSASGSSSGS